MNELDRTFSMRIGALLKPKGSPVFINPMTKGKNMNNHEVIISGVHMDLTDALKSTVADKIEKLIKHEDRILRIRVELEFNPNKDHQKEYVAKGHIEIHGPDMVASAASEDLYKSIDLMVNKLDRMLRQRSRLKRVKRKDVNHGLDIPAEVPKMVAA